MIDIIKLIHLNGRWNKISKKEINKAVAMATALLAAGKKKGTSDKILERRVISLLPDWVNSIKR